MYRVWVKENSYPMTFNFILSFLLFPLLIKCILSDIPYSTQCRTAENANRESRLLEGALEQRLQTYIHDGDGDEIGKVVI